METETELETEPLAIFAGQKKCKKSSSLSLSLPLPTCLPSGRAEYGILGNRSPTECTVHRLLFVIIPTMHIWQVFAFVFAIFKSIQYFLTTLCGFCHFVLLLSPPRFIGTKHFPSLSCYLLGAVWQVWRIHVEMSAASRHTHTHTPSCIQHKERNNKKNKRQKKTKPNRAEPRTVGKQWQCLMAPDGWPGLAWLLLRLRLRLRLRLLMVGYGNYTQHTRAHISGNNNSAQEASPGVSFQ